MDLHPYKSRNDIAAFWVTMSFLRFSSVVRHCFILYKSDSLTFRMQLIEVELSFSPKKLTLRIIFKLFLHQRLIMINTSPPNKTEPLKKYRLAIRIALAALAVVLLYVIIVIIHGTVTEYRPPHEEALDIVPPAQPKTALRPADTLNLTIWNIGYGGLGATTNFFYDDGRSLLAGDKMVRAPEATAANHLKGITDYINKKNADIYLLQEVDINSKRSYHNNQYEAIQKVLPEYASTFATNYKVERVPLPFAEPFNVMGKVHSGLATFSHILPTAATRLQLPGGYSWPNSIFHLDRCLEVTRFDVQDTTDAGRELVVINTHNSAYDQGGKLKLQEMAFLKAILIREYEAGNYVIVGGDWNQCPPYFSPNTFRPSMTPDEYYQINVPNNYMSADWLWAYAPTVPTNRKLADVYRGNEKTTFVTLIDFFLVSPNVEILRVKGVDMDFEYSDHQPVELRMVLK